MADYINKILELVKSLLNALKEGKAADIIGLIGDFFGGATAPAEPTE